MKKLKYFKNLCLFSAMFTLGFWNVFSQNPILLDSENAIHVIELEEWTELNESGPAFSPVEFGSGLLWVTYDKGGPSSRYLMSSKGSFRLKLAGDRENPRGAENYDPLSSERAVYGPVSWCSASEKLFVTANQNRAWQGRTRLGIYELNLKTGNSQHLPFVETKYNYAHPAWDAETGRLYFSSDFGSDGRQMDLYYADRFADGWSAPVKMAVGINSGSNEVFPFIGPEGLFFSSDRPGGPGGLDIYFSGKNGDNFSEPQLLTAPFNSSDDDFGVFVNREGNSGYLSSNRSGSVSGDKIFKFNCGLSCFLPASVSKTLEITVLSASDGSRLRDVEVFKIPETLFLQQLSSGNIDFDPMSNQLRMDVIDRLLAASGVQECKTGREGRCLIESRTNEKAFMLFLKGEGVQSAMNRVVFGEGFDHRTMEITMDRDCKPVEVVLKCPEGDSIENPVVYTEHLLNRVTDTIHPINGVYQECFKIGHQFVLHASAEKRHPSQQILVASNTTPETIVLVLEPEAVEVVKEGTVLELENIYYEYNSHLISPGAAKELDELASIMKIDTQMVIELRAHTDSRGSELYNLSLSQRRANSAMEYLIHAGIAQSRIRTVGLGESQLRNHCRPGVNCTEEEHAFNRRTEVAVLQAGEGVRAVRENGGLRFIVY